MNTTQETRPPETLSELLDLGIRSMRSLDRETYFPESMAWHEKPNEDEPCYVCLAGAVMAAVFKPDDHGNPSSYDDKWKECFMALEDLRTGDVVWAQKKMGGSLEDVSERLRYTDIENKNFVGWDETEEFLGEMEWLLDELKQEGL